MTASNESSDPADGSRDGLEDDDPCANGEILLLLPADAMRVEDALLLFTDERAVEEREDTGMDRAEEEKG